LGNLAWLLLKGQSVGWRKPVVFGLRWAELAAYDESQKSSFFLGEFEMFARIFLATTLLLMSSASFANQTCLSRVSNQDLLDELAERLSTRPPTSGEVMVSVSCRSYQLQINSTSLDGTSGSTSLNFSSAGACENFVNKFGRANTLRSNKIIGSCYSYQMSRILIKTDATFQQLPDINYSSAAECDAALEDLLAAP
jgi:hypothetical protein